MDHPDEVDLVSRLDEILTNNPSFWKITSVYIFTKDVYQYSQLIMDRN
jgi:hypothetical protein